MQVRHFLSKFADLLLTNEDLMQNHTLCLEDKEPNAKGKYIMTRINDSLWKS